jgi:lipid A 3-O-deacylase
MWLRRLQIPASGLVVAALCAQAPASRAEEGGARFARGAEAWGVSLGHGRGLGLWASGGEDAEDVRFTGLVPRYGLGLSDPVATDAWYRGNLELLLEGALFVATAPKGGFVGGANAVLRYNFLGWRRVVPFVDLGAGVGWLELDLDSQSDGLSFSPQGGLGFHWWLSPRTSLTASWRLHHLSNAGVGDDNVGINDSLLLVGFSYFP